MEDIGARSANLLFPAHKFNNLGRSTTGNRQCRRHGQDSLCSFASEFGKLGRLSSDELQTPRWLRRIVGDSRSPPAWLIAATRGFHSPPPEMAAAVGSLIITYPHARAFAPVLFSAQLRFINFVRAREGRRGKDGGPSLRAGDAAEIMDPCRPCRHPAT